MTLAKRIDLMHVQEQPLKEGELELIIWNKDLVLPPQLTQEKINRSWKEGKKANPKMFNANRFFLGSIKGNRLNCVMGRYSILYVASQLAQESNLTEREFEEYLRSGLAVLGLGVLLQNNQGDILLQKRSRDVFQGKGIFHIPSGGFMPQHFGESEYPNPFKSAKNQILDEQGIKDDEVTSLKYHGISRDTISSMNPTLVFSTSSDLDGETIKKRFESAKDNYETSNLVFISSGAEELLRTLKGEYIDVYGQPYDPSVDQIEILATGLGTFMLWGHNKYGKEWFKEACREVTKNNNPRIEQIKIYD